MAFRYPKNMQVGYNTPLAQDNIDTTRYYFGVEPWDHIAIAPRRFPNVRKVRFWVAISNSDTAALTAMMKIWPASSTNGKPFSPQTLDLSPGNFAPTGGNPFNPTPPGSGGVDNADFAFNRSGDLQTTNAINTGLPGMTVHTIEFDVFDATDADFFEFWNSIEGEDTFTAFQWALDVTSGPGGPAASDITVRQFGYEVTQAPASENIATTFIELQNRFNVTGTGNADYDINDAEPVFGLFRLRYRENDWNGIDSIHLMLFGGCKNNVSTTTVRLNRIDSDGTVTGSVAIAVTTVHESQTPAWGAANRYGYYRTEDLKDLLEDGNDYYFDYKHDNNPASGASETGGIMAWLEIKQRDFTRTTTTHSASINTVNWLVGESNSNAATYFHQSVFDPLHYEDVPESSFHAQELFASLRRGITVNDPEIVLYISAFLEGAETQPPLGASDIAILPSAKGSTVDNRWRWTQFTITANNPINLAGIRRLFYVKAIGGTWTGAQNEHGGALGLLYVFDVPNEETPELGPLFELDAFNPEGCAATSAGLGDNPGVLVITNGSTIPQKFNPVAQNIENAGIQEPFEDEVPQATSTDTAASPTGGLVPGIYTYRYTFCNPCTRKESDPNPDDIVVDTSARSPRAEVTLSFAGVQIPGDDQIDRICIYRTVVGGDFPVMAKVGELDISSGAFLFIDALEDDELDFDNDGLSLLNGAMPCVPVIVEHKNRLVGMGDIPNLTPEGTVTVTNGSQIVSGSGTEFSRCDVGKLIQIGSDCRQYEIARILAPELGSPDGEVRLKLSEEYDGTTDTGLLYTICGRPNRLYFSEPLEPECWPAINFLDVDPGDGDRLMGAVSNFDAILACKRNKSYRVAWRENPITEIVVPTLISKDVGMIGPRSPAQVASGSVFLADRGLGLFDGRSVTHLPESDHMNDLFTNPNNARYVRRDRNGRVIGAAGAFYPAKEQYLLLLPTVQTDRGANLMVVWDVSLRNITLFEFCQEFVSIEVGKDADGNQRVYLGDASGFVWLFDIGTNDGVGYPNSTGTVSGTVTRAGVDDNGASFFDDDNASFIIGGLPELAGGISGVGLSGLDGDSQLGLAGVCLFFRENENDEWKRRQIFLSNGTRIWVTPSWGADQPDEGWEYMLGPIEFNASFKPTDYGTADFEKRPWRHAIEYDPQQVGTQLQVELLFDFESVDPVSGTQLEDGRKARVFDLSLSRGKQVEPVERTIDNFLQVKLRNFAPDQPVRLLNHYLMITPKVSR